MGGSTEKVLQGVINLKQTFSIPHPIHLLDRMCVCVWGGGGVGGLGRGNKQVIVHRNNGDPPKCRLPFNMLEFCSKRRPSQYGSDVTSVDCKFQ